MAGHQQQPAVQRDVHLASVGQGLVADAAGRTRRERFRMPEFHKEMMRRGWLGDKTGQGFYKKVKGEGEKEILTLDVHTMEYRARQKARFASLETGKTIDDTKQRLRALIGPILEGQKGDKAQQFLWGALSETCLYAARRVPEISANLVDVDRARLRFPAADRDLRELVGGGEGGPE